MRESDLDAVIAIEERAYSYPWTRGIFADCLRVGYSCWVLALDDEVIGYGVLGVGAGEAHVLNICIAYSYQGAGYGGRLLARLIDLARWHRAGSVFLEVRPSNVAALGLYQSSGFEVVGRRPNYYPDADGREDALIMVRKLRT